MVTVASIDIGDGLAPGVTATDGTGVLAAGDTVYASPEHLYVAAPGWVDPESFAPGGPDVPTGDVAPQPVEVGTDIHRFDITDPTRAVYDMSGHVDGSLLGQFALDEHDGHLRVATTTGFSWAGGGERRPSPRATSRCSAPGDGALEAVGGVSGLGPGEDIFAVRFLGDVGYVVTFERTDPLYTIDLSDPAAPQVTGELEIPGYSAYLHPLGDGKLLGVGQDATTDGRTTGTQVSLFDVSRPGGAHPPDPGHVPGTRPRPPSPTTGRSCGGPNAGLAALPLSACGTDPFDGLVGLTVDAAAGTLTERGRVSHGGDPCGFGIVRPMPLPEPLPIEPGAGGGTDPSTGSSSPSAPAIAPEEVPPADDLDHADADPAVPRHRRSTVDALGHRDGAQRPRHADRHRAGAVQLVVRRGLVRPRR